jgi:hypothetical protein
VFDVRAAVLVCISLLTAGVEGWVRAADVELAKVRTRLEVDLSARRVTLFRDGRPVLETVGAIGSRATPTGKAVSTGCVASATASSAASFLRRLQELRS